MNIENYLDDLRKKSSTASAIKGWSVFTLIMGIIFGVCTIGVGVGMAILGQSVFNIDDSLLLIIIFAVSGIIIFLIFWIISLFIRGFGEIIQNTYTTSNSVMYQIDSMKEYMYKCEELVNNVSRLLKREENYPNYPQQSNHTVPVMNPMNQAANPMGQPVNPMNQAANPMGQPINPLMGQTVNPQGNQPVGSGMVQNTGIYGNQIPNTSAFNQGTQPANSLQNGTVVTPNNFGGYNQQNGISQSMNPNNKPFTTPAQGSVSTGTDPSNPYNV